MSVPLDRSVVARRDAQRQVFRRLLSGDREQLASVFAWLNTEQLAAVASGARQQLQDRLRVEERYALTPTGGALAAATFGPAEFTSI